MKSKTKKIKIPLGLSRDVGVMIEHFNDTLNLVAEQTSQIPKIKEDVAQIRDDLNNVKEDVELIKMDIETIKHDLKNKIDRNEFALLERRVALLESRR